MDRHLAVRLIRPFRFVDYQDNHNAHAETRSKIFFYAVYPRVRRERTMACRETHDQSIAMRNVLYRRCLEGSVSLLGLKLYVEQS